MKLSRALAALCAVSLAPLALATPAAHADAAYSGQVTATDPSAVLVGPAPGSEACGNGASETLRYDSVSFRSETSGPRRIALSYTGIEDSALVLVIRNGVCVATAFWADDDAEFAANQRDVDVYAERGDQVDLRIFASDGTHWTVQVLQPGSLDAPARGKAARRVSLPHQIDCASRTAHVTLTKKGRKAAKQGRYASIVLTANGQKVAKVKASKMRKAARKGIRLKGIPAGAPVTLKVVVKPRHGKKLKASRPYSAC